MRCCLKNVLTAFYVTVSGLIHKRCLCMYIYVKEKPETYLLYFMLLVGVAALFSVYRICGVTCLEDYINSSQT